jgi:5-methylthioadenosine/S-adenosylhomocysteine deaminase
MDLLVRGRHVITAASAGRAGVLDDSAVLVSGSRISAVGEGASLRRRHPRARVVGSGKRLLMPGLIDAHSHGRALSPIQKGVLNDYLENNLLDWAFMPVFDPELMASLAVWRHLRSGCTTMRHMGFDTEGPGARARCES